ncbi:glycosyl transferase [Candidatus Woesebacteria bacterium]|nr:glycosyl transferase [Candidatus Woesebacteria bacterium]
MKVALVYDRVNKWGGAERVLLALHELFPDAPLYTSVYNQETAPWAKVFPKVIPSFLQTFPFAKSRHDLYAPLMPVAFESFDFSEYDLVISVTSEAAKGIITKPGTQHVCYCLTPTRYLWSGYKQYFKNDFLKIVTKPIVSYLRAWDKVAAQRPDIMLAISKNVSSRIKKFYGKNSTLVYPPVDASNFQFPVPSSQRKEGDYFLVVSRLVLYKRVGLVIEVFNRLKLPLIIVGTGSEEKSLKMQAKSKNIKFVGQVSDKELAGYYAGCRAVIFPQEEDFGIVAVEAQAASKPVIAYKAGGALEIIVDGKTGIFFDKQTSSSQKDAIDKFSKMKFNEEDCTNSARRFSKKKFASQFGRLVKLPE